MSIRSKFAIVSVLSGALSFAQDAGVDLRGGFKINFAKNSPLTLVSADLGESKASARGGLMVLDLHTSLRLRNSGGRHVRGVTLLVLAQEVTPGGKGSVAVPALDVAPGDDFPIRIDLRMLRPISNAPGPLVQVLLDGVLFDDLSFFGDNKLNSKRNLTIWELEARRDRKHFQQVLESRGSDGLQREMATTIARHTDRPRVA